MIQSMTGYAAASVESPMGRLSLELRSVNSRFLDLQFRVAEDLRALEPLLRERIVARVSRGKIDCRLYLSQEGDSRKAQVLDPKAVARLKALGEDAAKLFADAAPLRLADVLRWPGIISETLPDEAQLREIALQLCGEAMEELVAARAREGAKLAAVIRERVAEMRRRVEEVAPLVPQAVTAYQAKLVERLREAMGSGNDERIRTEVALFATKVDVDEELERLGAHFSEVERTLTEGGAHGSPRGSPVGKRLDFLAQELNREANTLASKASSGKIADCALELKLLVEQVREQVQNIE